MNFILKTKNNSYAVAEIGDRLTTADTDRIVVMGCCAPFHGGSWVKKNMTSGTRRAISNIKRLNPTSSKRSWMSEITRWRHNPTTILQLTSQTKLTLNVTLTLTLTLLSRNICAHIVDTHNNFFPEFIKGILCARSVSWVCGWDKELHYLRKSDDD